MEGLVVLVVPVAAVVAVLAPLLSSDEEWAALDGRGPGVNNALGYEIEARDGGPDATSAETPIRRYCPRCGTLVEADFEFCGACASPVVRTGRSRPAD